MKIPDINETKTIEVILCGCHGEGLAIEVDRPDVAISFWKEGFHPGTQMTIKNRLRWMWHILWNGAPWTDMVLFNENQLGTLIDRLGDVLYGLRDAEDKNK